MGEAQPPRGAHHLPSALHPHGIERIDPRAGGGVKFGQHQRMALGPQPRIGLGADLGRGGVGGDLGEALGQRGEIKPPVPPMMIGRGPPSRWAAKIGGAISRSQWPTE